MTLEENQQDRKSTPPPPTKVKMDSQVLTIGYVNIHGQSGLTSAKQSQIESFICSEKIDILHLQEINISEESFNSCPIISSSFNLIANNSPTKYGTASLLKSDLSAENIRLDPDGRMILFDVGPLTLANLYLPSGTDAMSRSSREQCLSETLPQLLLNKMDTGVIGGDLNCVLNKLDCTSHPAAKMSPSLAKLVRVGDLSDCFRKLHPTAKVYSHFYNTIHHGQGATRIDRSYSWGDVNVVSAKYEPIAFSDHMAHIINISLPSSLSRILSPRSRPLIKVRPEVIRDKKFQELLAESMADWIIVKERGLDILDWWEMVVKPGIRKLSIKRSKEINMERRGMLNLLMLQQSYLARKLQSGEIRRLGELRDTQKQIQDWYQKEGEKLVLKARTDEVNLNEKVRLFHHELHKKHIKKTSIL